MLFYLDFYFCCGIYIDMNSATQTGASNMSTRVKVSQSNTYYAVKSDGTKFITSDLWEAVKHCDPELKHNAMQDTETGKPVSPMAFKNSCNGSVLSIGISTRKKYARKDDRIVLGTVSLYTNDCSRN